MKTRTTEIEECLLYELKRFNDNRGFFQEICRWPDIIQMEQVNWSFSKQDTIRGLHISTFNKFVTCVSGSIYDVVVDMRKDSKTYLKQAVVTLNSNEPTSLYIPGGCAHGFMALTDATVVYLQSDTYKPKNEKSIHYSFSEWPKPISGAYIVSEKDEKAEKWIQKTIGQN